VRILNLDIDALIVAAFHFCCSPTFDAGFSRGVDLDRSKAVEAIMQVQRETGYGTNVQQDK
jgi:hypothetical protein